MYLVFSAQDDVLQIFKPFYVMFPMLIQWEAIKIKYFIMLGKKATKSGLTKMW